MKYLLDTNTCIRYINGRAPLIRTRLSQVPREMVAVSIITKAEMYYGSAKSQSPALSLQKQQEFLATIPTLVIDEAAALEYAAIRVALERAGTPIGGNDMLIASTALALELILVTHNTTEFARIPRLKLEDWEI